MKSNYNLNTKSIDETFDDFEKNHAGPIANIFDRWLDECEYEDFKDYRDVIKKTVPNCIKVTSKPFQLVIACTDGQLFFKFKLNKNNQIVLETSHLYIGGEIKC